MNCALILIGIIILSACDMQRKNSENIVMGNPASVYCTKVGGKMDIVRGLGGDDGYCTLPGGERLEEWSLYRRDNIK